MSSGSLQIRIEGVDAVLRKIDALGKSLDTRTILDQSAALLFHHIMERFLMLQTDADGNPWEPLSGKYAKVKQKKWNGGGILYASGKLSRSIQVYAVDDNSRAIGTDVPYAKFHQFGTVRMPKREFLAFGDSDVTLVQDYLVRKVTEAINS